MEKRLRLYLGIRRIKAKIIQQLQWSWDRNKTLWATLNTRKYRIVIQWSQGDSGLCFCKPLMGARDYVTSCIMGARDYVTSSIMGVRDYVTSSIMGVRYYVTSSIMGAHQMGLSETHKIGNNANSIGGFTMWKKSSAKMLSVSVALENIAI